MSEKAVETVILCVTLSGCTCGAPADTPSGMHHDHCAVNPAEPDGSGCRICKIKPGGAGSAHLAPCGHPWPDPEDDEPYAEGDAWMYDPNAPRCACGRYPTTPPASDTTP